MTDPTETKAQTQSRPPPPQSRSGTGGRGVKIALAISVALNLAVAGLVAGVVLQGGPGGHREMMVRDMGFGPFDQALLPEDRDALRKALGERFVDVRISRQQMQTDVQAILSAMRADPFVPTALSAALQTQAGHMGERLQLGNDLIGNYLLAMPDDARRAFADRLEDRMKRGPGDDRGKDDGRDGNMDDG